MDLIDLLFVDKKCVVFVFLLVVEEVVSELLDFIDKLIVF